MKSNLNFQTVLFQFTTSEVLLGKVSEDQENLSPNFFLFWYSLESLISGLFLVRSPGKLFSMKIFFLSCGWCWCWLASSHFPFSKAESQTEKKNTVGGKNCANNLPFLYLKKITELSSVKSLQSSNGWSPKPAKLQKFYIYFLKRHFAPCARGK